MRKRIANWIEVAKHTPVHPISSQVTKMQIRMTWSKVEKARTKQFAKVYF